MSKDLLEEATRALRDQENASELETRATRTRIMASLHQSRVKKRTRIAFLLPIAATFVAASAWGAASGQARALLNGVERWVGIASPTPSTASVRPVQRPAAAHVPAPQAAPLPELETPPPPSAKAAPSGSARAEAIDPSLALYRAAHAAHFVDRDPERALGAWDAYLAAAPRGQLAPEARYNRALALVRLGRIAEARTALEPFASGRMGGYRKAEATALLERLPD